MSIPAFSEADIEELVGRRSLRQGREYHRDGAIVEAQREGLVLRAACIGSGREPYYVQARFDEQRLRECRCTCPVGHSGTCKHVAALLITWRETPEVFAESESWERLLHRCNRRELIGMVKRVIEHRPETQRLIEPLLPTEGNGGGQGSLTRQQRRIAEAAASAEATPEGRRRLAEQLLAFKESADELCAQRELADAAGLYHAVLAAVVEHPQHVDPRQGDWAGLLADAVEMLGLCLPSLADDLETRLAVFRTLVGLVCLEAVGGVPAPTDLSRMLLAEVRREERGPLVEAIRALLPAQPAGTARRTLGGLLLELAGGELDEAQWIDVCRQTGRVLDVVRRHLSAGRPEAAVEEAGRAEEDELPQVAALLARWGRADDGRRLVEQRLAAGPSPVLKRWLDDDQARRGHLAAVLQQAGKLFRVEPSAALYRELRSVARQLGKWDALRPKLLELLGRGPQRSLLVAILLEEHELGAALEIVAGEAAELEEGGLALRVAQAAAATRPEEAAALYQELARRLIARRGRQNFSAALGYLRKARGLWKRAGEARRWHTFWNDLLRTNRAWRLFADELRPASSSREGFPLP